MDIEKYKSLAKNLVNLGLQKGASTVEVSISDNQKFDVSVRKSEIETLTQAGSSNLVIVVTKDKKKASVSSSDLRESSVEKLLSDALTFTNYTEKDSFLSLPPKDELGSIGDLQIYDDKIDDISPEKKIEIAKQLEEIALQQDKRLLSESSSVSTYKGIKVFANSLDFCEGFKYSNSSFGVSLFVEDKGSGENKNRKQSDGWYDTNVFFNKLDDIKSIAKTAAERTLRKIGAKKPKTQEVPVIFDSNMAASFISSLADACSGGNIYRKQSFLCDKIGTTFGENHFTLTDDPTMKSCVGSKPFDSEGVRARQNTIFENGVFKKYLLDNYSANKLNLKTNGCSGGYSNLYLTNGKMSLEELISTVKEGLYLTTMSGQGANIITGGYSRGAQGIWIENGKLSYPVNEITIGSTFIEMIKNLKLVGNDLKFKSRVNSPSFKIDKMTISGS